MAERALPSEAATGADVDAASGVRVLVAIGINPLGEPLLKRAARLAGALGGQLFALHVAPPGQSTSLYAANLAWHLKRARDLGARVEIVEGRDIAETMLRFARERRVTHIVLGQSDVSRWREIIRGSVVNRIQRMILDQQLDIDLYIVMSRHGHE